MERSALAGSVDRAAAEFGARALEDVQHRLGDPVQLGHVVRGRGRPACDLVAKHKRVASDDSEGKKAPVTAPPRAMSQCLPSCTNQPFPSVREIIDVAFPRPRDVEQVRATDRYDELRLHIWNELRPEAAASVA